MIAPSSCAVAALALATCIANSGVLLDYGADPGALNDAGIIRNADNPYDQFGFDQYQLINIDDAAWRIDRLTLAMRVWNTTATGEATLVIYEAEGLEPNLLERVSTDVAFSVSSLVGEVVRLDLGGLELSRGVYFVGVHAAEPTSELLWFAGIDDAFRTAGRSDGEFLSASPRALSLVVEGAVVPAPGGALALLLGVVRRRRT